MKYKLEWSKKYDADKSSRDDIRNSTNDVPHNRLVKGEGGRAVNNYRDASAEGQEGSNVIKSKNSRRSQKKCRCEK